MTTTLARVELTLQFWHSSGIILMKPVYILIGIPGAGKDTQSSILSEKLHVPKVDTGDTIGAFLKSNPEKVDELLKLYQSGPFPTEFMVYILREKFKTILLENGLVLNLKPKSIDEILQVQQLLKEFSLEIKKVFYLKISKKIAFERAIKRLNGQFTEKEPTIEKLTERVDSFIDHFPVILDHLKSLGLLVEINGELSQAEVTSEIFKHLNSNPGNG